MAQFQVIALSLGGMRNRIFSSGDVVTQDQLPVDVSELVAKGFLKPLDVEPKAEEPSMLAAIKAASDEAEPAGYPDMDDMSVKEIKAALGDRAPKGFTPKADLYAMLVG